MNYTDYQNEVNAFYKERNDAIDKLKKEISAAENIKDLRAKILTLEELENKRVSIFKEFKEKAPSDNVWEPSNQIEQKLKVIIAKYKLEYMSSNGDGVYDNNIKLQSIENYFSSVYDNTVIEYSNKNCIENIDPSVRDVLNGRIHPLKKITKLSFKYVDFHRLILPFLHDKQDPVIYENATTANLSCAAWAIFLAKNNLLSTGELMDIWKCIESKAVVPKYNYGKVYQVYKTKNKSLNM